MSAPCRKAAFGLIVSSLLAPTAAFALDNDPALRGFADCDGNGVCKGNQSLFRNYVREMGMAMAPKLLAPAETLGINGFALSLGEYSVTNIREDKEYWSRGTEQTLAETTAHEQSPDLNGEAAPPGVLHTVDFRVRKGLPYSLEIGGSFTYLLDSEFFAFGGELKWALNEAVEQLPIDFAVQAAVNRCFGSTELDLTTVGMNLILSRGFGAGGVVNIAPYMAYNPVFVFARSGVLDATPGLRRGQERPGRGQRLRPRERGRHAPSLRARRPVRHGRAEHHAGDRPHAGAAELQRAARPGLLTDSAAQPSSGGSSETSPRCASMRSSRSFSRCRSRCNWWIVWPGTRLFMRSSRRAWASSTAWVF
jgi:hypothetical protein